MEYENPRSTTILMFKVEEFDLLKPVLEQTVKEIRNLSDCESVAIRLKDDGDFPLYVHEGFHDLFIRKENSLNVRDGEGNLVLDADGTPVVDCMCGNILKRRYNPNFSFFTDKGSFWTNSTTELLATLTEEEQEEVGQTRDSCHQFGYESVALIPIQVNNDSYGLILMNDPREDMFTQEKIVKYELIADKIGKVVGTILEAKERILNVFKLIDEYKKDEE